MIKRGSRNKRGTCILISDKHENLIKSKRSNSRFKLQYSNNLLNSKRSQQLFGMPFSMIFSIFLIVVFLVVAFFAIKYVMGIFGCLNTGDFIESLRTDVESARNSAFSGNTFKGNLPAGVEYACFADLSQKASGTAKEKEIYAELRRNADYTANLFFYPQGKACPKATNIEHVDFSESNPYCFPVEDGKVEIRIEKGRFDSLVKVSRT